MSVRREYIPKTNRKVNKTIQKDFKFCNKCSKEKPLYQFYVDKSKASNISSYCKECTIHISITKGINRYHSDSSYKIKKLLRGRLRAALNGIVKSKSTTKLLGCSIEQLKQHLQETALKNGYLDFNIENYDSSKYHIDHILPCASFNLECSYHQKICFNWSNLQILLGIENISKSDNWLR